MNQCIYNKNCRILRFNPPQITTHFELEITRFGQFPRKNRVGHSNQKPPSCFSMGFFASSLPVLKHQADMTLLDQIFSKERTLSTSLTEKVGDRRRRFLQM